MAKQSEGENAQCLRGIDKEIQELNHELKTMQGYIYKLKNQHRRTPYFRATSNAYKSCLRTVKATESISSHSGEPETKDIEGQRRKNALNLLYKEAFKRLHQAAR